MKATATSQPHTTLERVHMSPAFQVNTQLRGCVGKSKCSLHTDGEKESFALEVRFASLFAGKAMPLLMFAEEVCLLQVRFLVHLK